MIAPMFWGDRIPLEECANGALEWLLSNAPDSPA